MIYIIYVPNSNQIGKYMRVKQTEWGNWIIEEKLLCGRTANKWVENIHNGVYKSKELAEEYIQQTFPKTERIADEQECKSCDYFSLYENICLIDESKGYDNGRCLHEGCEQYEEVHWHPM